MRRVVITGLGIVSSIGNNRQEVESSLRSGRSGIEFQPEHAELGFRSHVYGPIRLNLDELIDRKLKRFMGDGAAYAFLAMEEAIKDAGVEDAEISNPKTGLIVGSGGASHENVVRAVDLLRKKGVRRVGPYMVTRTMSSTNAACLGTAYKIKGVSYSISSACASSAHCIGNAAELIQLGKQDMVFAGGGEEVHWAGSLMFDAMGALSSKYNDTPDQASRPYDVDRDGFVISGGGGILVVEELQHAKNRGAKIYAELVGYGATADGHDMVQPSGEGAVRCMRQAMDGVTAPIGYINTHGTSTPIGDLAELNAVREVFAKTETPIIGSTKSLTGHALGAAGVNEAIYALIMMESGFIAASANIQNLDPEADGLPIARTLQENVSLQAAMSNSFGFGGTNSTLVFQQYFE